MEGSSSLGPGDMLYGALTQGSGKRVCGRLAYSSVGPDKLLSRRDLSRVCVCGGDEARGRMIMELVLREAESDERYLIIDLNGVFSPLIDYSSSLRVYKLGRYASLNPFKMFNANCDPSKTISALIQQYYELSRDERIYLERGLEMVYGDRIFEPTLDDVNDRLLNIQAEVQPKEAYKVECLKNVLWQMQNGALGAMLRTKESEFKIPAILDLSTIRVFREKAFVAISILLRADILDASALVLDPVDELLSEEYAQQKSLLKTIQECFRKLARRGTMLHYGAISTKVLPKMLGEGASAYLFCGPLWEGDLLSVERSFALDRSEARELRQLDDGSVLVCASGRGAPIFTRPHFSDFRQIPESEVLEHMRVLGEEPIELQIGRKSTETKMLEKVFKDRAALVYAWEVLRLVREGKVPVDSVSSQKNVLLKSVVKSLKRYFMIVEYTDSTSMVWYRLTKIGERAISEMEGDDELIGDAGGTKFDSSSDSGKNGSGTRGAAGRK